jgi:hypothetical protein
MRNPLLSICVLAVVAGAAVPNKFSSGKPVIAQDVNDNFTYLDSTVAKKADASVKTDLDATKSDVKALQAKQRADSSTLAASAANGLSMATVNTNLAGLRDTVGKKKDSAWIMKAVTPAAIGAVPAMGGTANALAKWTNATTLGASGITDDGSVVTIGRKAVFGSDIVLPDNVGKALKGGRYSAAEPYLYIDALGTSGANSCGIVLKTNTGTSGVNALTLNGDGSAIFASKLSSQDITATSLRTSGASYSAVYTTGRGASDSPFMGAYFRVVDSSNDSTVTKGWMMQLGASNTLDFWNHASGWSGKPLIQFLPTGTVKTASLDVGGDIKVAGSLKTAPGSVKSSDVADYVFEPSYKLAALSEVEAFAKEHKHLPEVPSATEIEHGGLDLAQMNLVLLKKVEELTLHAIDQQKAIEQQRQEMAQVKAELKSLKRD